MKSEQQKVKEKIDSFVTGFAEKQIYGWKPELDKEYSAGTEKNEEKESLLHLTRMPLWCPKCKRVMNKKLDNKMYRIHNTCFDCVIEMEHKIRVEGKWEEYQKNKIKENIRSYIKDCEQQVKEEKDTLDRGLTQVDVVNEDLGSIQYEKWKLSEEDIKNFKNKMDVVLKDMHDDFEKTFGEKVHVEQIC